MATNDQLKALVKRHADRDDSQFYSVAVQVAAKAARSGQDKFAQELRDMVDALRKREPGSSRVASVVPVSQPRGELASLLTVSYPTARVADLVLSEDLSERLRHVLHEQRQRDVLSRHGLTPVRRMLLIGPPGTGKSGDEVIAADLGTARQDGSLRGLARPSMSRADLPRNFLRVSEQTSAPEFS
jgi:SpoVK/Ycf46/Vps4 family AAA+-type ATPase